MQENPGLKGLNVSHDTTLEVGIPSWKEDLVLFTGPVQPPSTFALKSPWEEGREVAQTVNTADLMKRGSPNTKPGRSTQTQECLLVPLPFGMDATVRGTRNQKTMRITSVVNKQTNKVCLNTKTNQTSIPTNKPKSKWLTPNYT